MPQRSCILLLAACLPPPHFNTLLSLPLPSLHPPSTLSPPSLYPLSTLPLPSLHPPSTLSLPSLYPLSTLPLPSLYPPSFITQDRHRRGSSSSYSFSSPHLSLWSRSLETEGKVVEFCTTTLFPDIIYP